MQKFGGRWTHQKLRILADYLDAYTTALKGTNFTLMYIDAFAGTGSISLQDRDDDHRSFAEGSVERAIRVGDKPFDELIFVENHDARYAKLKERMDERNGDRVQVVKEDANHFLQRLDRDWRRTRGVLFLDPFATEVQWATIERVASLEALDMWILFPVMALSRLLPREQVPTENHAHILDKVFGGDNWQELYGPEPQLSFFGDEKQERNRGPDNLVHLYKQQLRDLFDNRFMDKSVRFRNSMNTPLFEFIFCVGSRSTNAVRLAKKIAKYIVDSSDAQEEWRAPSASATSTQY